MKLKHIFLMWLLNFSISYGSQINNDDNRKIIIGYNQEIILKLFNSNQLLELKQELLQQNELDTFSKQSIEDTFTNWPNIEHIKRTLEKRIICIRGQIISDGSSNRFGN